MNSKLKRAISLSIVAIIGASGLSVFSGCKGKKKAVTIMTEQLNGLFNPFYSTAGTDMEVVGMTQLSMLTTDEDGQPACGENEATVVLDYDKTTNDSGNSVYRFVLKNNLLFSDGYALTMNDVMFNLYEYLDPVYTGSSTLYSTKIVGLQAYRRQKNLSGAATDDISLEANSLASGRVQELIDIYVEASREADPNSTSYHATEQQMESYIKNTYLPGYGYTDAVPENKNGPSDDAYYRDCALADYKHICELFKEELGNDFDSAQEAYDTTQPPYAKWADAKHFKNPVFNFFYYEGFIDVEYELGTNNKYDKTNIKSFDDKGYVSKYDTKEKAIEYLYNHFIQSNFDLVIQGFGTANTIFTEFAAEARDVLLHKDVTDGSLPYPTITGIRSLGHEGQSSVTVNGKSYNVATSHDENFADGTNKNYGAVTDSNTHDVLEIEVEGTDPKAIYNFGFSVAPVHYYTADDAHPNGRQVDIKNKEFGVPWSSYEFQSKTIQSPLHVSVPVGAGPFVATDEKDGDNPTRNTFMNSNIVYYKKNNNFSCLGPQFEVKTERLRFQVLSSNNALDNLERGAVDYVTPQLTKDNSKRLTELQKKGFESMAGWQLGYGYIGINAGKVKNYHVRRAIMAAMEPKLATSFYEINTCKVINWPMSTVGWAYPKDSNGADDPNGKSWLQFNDDDKVNYTATINKIKSEMELAQTEGAPFTKSDLKIKFTIAGSSITDHPTYNVFKQAAEILNMSETGFQIEVVADSQALTKLATASLAVWAAAWGSTIDPDMYQVYSPYSTASSPKTWGYEQMTTDSSTYSYEWNLLLGEGNSAGHNLADLIDEGRTIDDQARRKAIYKEAMGIVLDLAVEMPVYQRQVVYAYNSKTIKGFSDCLIKEGEYAGLVNPYSSPLGRIWEIELV